MLEEVVRTLAPSGSAGATIELENPYIDIPVQRALFQVFVNLIKNSLDAVETLGPRGLVRVRVRRVADHVDVEVEDNGVGVAPEDLRRGFEPFFTTKDVGRGTGLGLPISARIVERCGGTIRFESETPPSDVSDEPLLDAPSPVDLSKVTVFTNALHSGFLLPAARLAVFTEHELFGRLKRRGTSRRAAFRGISQKELQQLRRGDFVVHQDYGIGKFAGLQKIRLSGIEQEVMKLLYEDNGIVYVNLNAIGRVQKYSSQEGHSPKLSTLGTPHWERLKERAKKRIKDIARELITLYARRKHNPGFSFSVDSHWQKEMEASFLFEDTKWQAIPAVVGAHPRPWSRRSLWHCSRSVG